MATPFHSMIGYLMNKAGIHGGRYNWNEFTQQAPEFLIDALSIIRSPDSI